MDNDIREKFGAIAIEKATATILAWGGRGKPGIYVQLSAEFIKMLHDRMDENREIWFGEDDIMQTLDFGILMGLLFSHRPQRKGGGRPPLDPNDKLDEARDLKELVDQLTSRYGKTRAIDLVAEDEELSVTTIKERLRFFKMHGRET